mmetsp:Transcript_41971/g.110881  ORF Transcript_41971/g.110881 Transcript_41971/m.110881 type:complete len:128 (-) Transcript_41971:213-596(-)
MRSHRRVFVVAAVVTVAAQTPLPNLFSVYRVARSGEGPERRRSGGMARRPQSRTRGAVEASASSTKAQALRQATDVRSPGGRDKSARDREAAIREFERTMKMIEEEHLNRAEFDLEEMYILVERDDS